MIKGPGPGFWQRSKRHVGLAIPAPLLLPPLPGSAPAGRPSEHGRILPEPHSFAEGGGDIGGPDALWADDACGWAWGSLRPPHPSLHRELRPLSLGQEEVQQRGPSPRNPSDPLTSCTTLDESHLPEPRVAIHQAGFLHPALAPSRSTCPPPETK